MKTTPRQARKRAAKLARKASRQTLNPAQERALVVLLLAMLLRGAQ